MRVGRESFCIHSPFPPGREKTAQSTFLLRRPPTPFSEVRRRLTALGVRAGAVEAWAGATTHTHTRAPECVCVKISSPHGDDRVASARGAAKVVGHCSLAKGEIAGNAGIAENAEKLKTL